MKPRAGLDHVASEYDVIIVGAGSAGATLAGRLSEAADRSVLLIEAGPLDRAHSIDMPGAAHMSFMSPRYNGTDDTLPQSELGGRRLTSRRGEVMVEPEDVSAMLRLKQLGWGARHIAAELGVSRTTVSDWLEAGGWRPFRQPQREKALDGLEAWLRERFRRHRGNADVLRQELASEKGIAVCLRTAERAVEPYRKELEAEAGACVRFETPPG